MLKLFLAFLLSCASIATAQSAPDSTYPAHWWKSVPKDSAAWWEVLPQAAGKGEVILSKRNELGLLSNFAATPFTYRGKTYASVEGFWQMMLYPENAADARAIFRGLRWYYKRDSVAQLTAFKAKEAGDFGEENMKKMGITWVTFEGKQFEYRSQAVGEHYKLIVEAMWEKVRQNPDVKHALLATGELLLRPDHIQESGAPPEWRYNEVWMEIRSQLRKEGK